MSDSQMNEPVEPTPQDDAERIRLKRLAKLQNAPSVTPEASSSAPGPSIQPAQAPARRVTPKSIPVQVATPPPVQKRTPQKQPVHLPFNLSAWEPEVVGKVLNVTLEREIAEKSSWSIVWLKELAQEIEQENGGTLLPLTSDIADRLLIARLDLDRQSISEDPELLTVLAGLPAEETVFEYLVGCWKRLNSTRSVLVKQKSLSQPDLEKSQAILAQLRKLITTYAGLTIQDSSMFPQPITSKALGAPELINPLLAVAAPPLSSSTSILAPHEVETFITDLANRFEEDGMLEDVFGVLVEAAVNVVKADIQGLGNAMSNVVGWRAGLDAIEALSRIKSLAAMLTRLDYWNPPNVVAPSIEHLSLMGPLVRLGVFGREWPSIAKLYFTDLSKRTRADVDSTNTNLRNTLVALQQSLFNIFNAIVRSGTPPREAVLDYFAKAVQINVKRGGMHVDPATVASDGYMINLQAVLLRLAEPFMDSKYSKIDKIDPLYFVRSKRLDIKEETRIKANAEEAKAFAEESTAGGVPAQNFITEIFFLTAAYNHYGFLRTVQANDDLNKQLDEIQRALDHVEADQSWRGTPMQAQAEAHIQRIKNEQSRVQSEVVAYQVQLLDPEILFRLIGFVTFSIVWLIRLIDPQKKYPSARPTLPLPDEIPPVFKMLPEYLIEDVVDFSLFILRHKPESLDLSGKNELLDFIVTFLTSTSYIKNPYLKAKLVTILFYGTIPYGSERQGALGGMLNTHPLCLKHLLPSLMSFYIEVEQTGAHSQFYDKFDSRRSIAYILKAIWNNPHHRDALNIELQRMDKFIRFANLLMNDATFLLDESLSKLAEIHNIQVEMQNREVWDAQPAQVRKERERLLKSLESQATSYTSLGKSTVQLLKEFTAETKPPFMAPEIVDRLAAMLNYNLDALAGPKCSKLKVKDMDKYRFNPQQLLSDILQVYINLSDQPDFVKAVAGEGRSYRKELFESAAGIARNKHLKSEDEIEILRLFVIKVEETKALLEAEEDLGEVPDEFLDPLMYTLMRDPVILPSSRTVIDHSTIKAHLLSDTTDPFNRVPLKLEEVIPNPELKARIDEFLASRKTRATESLRVPQDERFQEEAPMEDAEE